MTHDFRDIRVDSPTPDKFICRDLTKNTLIGKLFHQTSAVVLAVLHFREEPHTVTTAFLGIVQSSVGRVYQSFD